MIEMSPNKKYSILTAIFGVIIGALLVIIVDKATEKNRRIRSEYGDWRKLNLILQTVDEMYVDTVDYTTVTDAAVAAAKQIVGGGNG